MFYFHPRMAWFPILIGSIYSFFFWKENLYKTWILFPFFIFIWFAFGYSATSLSESEKISLIKFYYFFRDREEVSFIFHNYKSITILILTFFTYPFLIKKLHSYNFKILSIIVYILSLIIFFSDWLYSSFFFEIFPIPQIYALAFPRSFFVFEFFFLFCYLILF